MPQGVSMPDGTQGNTIPTPSPRITVAFPDQPARRTAVAIGWAERRSVARPGSAWRPHHIRAAIARCDGGGAAGRASGLTQGAAARVWRGGRLRRHSAVTAGRPPGFPDRPRGNGLPTIGASRRLKLSHRHRRRR
jgi:hypothetical protein